MSLRLIERSGKDDVLGEREMGLTGHWERGEMRGRK